MDDEGHLTQLLLVLPGVVAAEEQFSSGQELGLDICLGAAAIASILSGEPRLLCE